MPSGATTPILKGANTPSKVDTLRWLQLSIKAPPEYVEPLTHLFNTHGEGSASVEQIGGYNPDEGESPDPTAWVTIRGWLPLDATTESRKTGIDVGVRLIRYLVDLPEIEEREVSNDEWHNQKFAGFTEMSTILAGSIPHGDVPDGGFDVVGANIAANVLIMLAEPLIASVADDGVIITSGVLDTRLDDVVAAFESVGGEIESTRKIEDWTATRIVRASGHVVGGS
jgi:hypothetical protein